MKNLDAKQVLCTGTFLGTRQQVNNYIAGVGGIAISTPRNSMNLLVISEKPGTLKLDFVLQKNILVITEKELYELTDVLPRYATINKRGTLRSFEQLLPPGYGGFVYNRDIDKVFGNTNIKTTIVGAVASNKPKNFLKFEI